MTRRSIRWLLSGISIFGFRIWCQLCSAEFASEAELAAHTFSAHPRGR